MINKSAFISVLKSNVEAKEICDKYVFSSVVWLFERDQPGQSSAVYQRVRTFFSKKLDLRYDDISIVGSAKLGFSLNPHHALRNFNSTRSDIDLVLVSGTLFHSFWNELFRLFYTNGVFVDSAYFKPVFLKYITPDEDESFPSAIISDWQRKISDLRKDFFANFKIGNEIKYRVYESWDAVNSYHIDGIERLRGKINATTQ